MHQRPFAVRCASFPDVNNLFGISKCTSVWQSIDQCLRFGFFKGKNCSCYNKNSIFIVLLLNIYAKFKIVRLFVSFCILIVCNCTKVLLIFHIKCISYWFSGKLCTFICYSLIPKTIKVNRKCWQPLLYRHTYSTSTWNVNSVKPAPMKHIHTHYFKL